MNSFRFHCTVHSLLDGFDTILSLVVALLPSGCVLKFNTRTVAHQERPKSIFSANEHLGSVSGKPSHDADLVAELHYRLVNIRLRMKAHCLTEFATVHQQCTFVTSNALNRIKEHIIVPVAIQTIKPIAIVAGWILTSKRHDSMTSPFLVSMLKGLLRQFLGQMPLLHQIFCLQRRMSMF